MHSNSNTIGILYCNYSNSYSIYHTGEKYESIPNSGFVIMMGVAHAKMMEVLFCEYEGRPIRINEVWAVV